MLNCRYFLVLNWRYANQNSCCKYLRVCLLLLLHFMHSLAHYSDYSRGYSQLFSLFSHYSGIIPEYHLLSKFSKLFPHNSCMPIGWCCYLLRTWLCCFIVITIIIGSGSGLLALTRWSVVIGSRWSCSVRLSLSVMLVTQMWSSLIIYTRSRGWIGYCSVCDLDQLVSNGKAVPVGNCLPLIRGSGDWHELSSFPVWPTDLGKVRNWECALFSACATCLWSLLWWYC